MYKYLIGLPVLALLIWGAIAYHDKTVRDAALAAVELESAKAQTRIDNAYLDNYISVLSDDNINEWLYNNASDSKATMSEGLEADISKQGSDTVPFGQVQERAESFAPQLGDTQEELCRWEIVESLFRWVCYD